MAKRLLHILMIAHRPDLMVHVPMQVGVKPQIGLIVNDVSRQVSVRDDQCVVKGLQQD